MSEWRSRPRAAARAGGAAAVVLMLVTGCGSAERTGTAPAPTPTTVDWRSTTYTVTCDGIVPDGFPATVDGGAARVPADQDRPPHYDYFDIRVAGTGSGDVDGDGAADTVVLLDCSPQPSNGVLQEVQVFSSTGRGLGT